MAFVATLRSERSATASLNSRRSITADTHSASTTTNEAAATPSKSSIRLSLDLPRLNWISSSSRVTKGNTPISQSAIPSQTSHEKKRSTKCQVVESGKARLSTRAINRIAASAASIRVATRKSAKSGLLNRVTRTTYTSVRLKSGNMTPSINLRPNKTELPASGSSACIARRKAQAMAQAAPKQASSADTSQTKPSRLASASNAVT